MKKAFTLVELIVVITILVILGAISFISIQGYGKEVRDTKRISDTRSLLTKINVENTTGRPLSELIIGDRTTLQILGKDNDSVYTMGHVNFTNLKENPNDFKDPRDGQDYYFAYAIGETGSGRYNFIQGATISEIQDITRILGNYYTTTTGDAPSLFLKNSGNKKNPNDYYTSGSTPIYDVNDRGSTAPLYPQVTVGNATENLGCTGNDIIIKYSDTENITMAGCNSNVGTSSYDECTTNATHCQGKYYTWENAPTACLSPWRLPTETELRTMLSSLGWKSNSPTNSPYNLALAGHDGGDTIAFYGDYWSSTPNKSDYGYAYRLYITSNLTVVSRSDKDFAFSVRCVKD